MTKLTPFIYYESQNSNMAFSKEYTVYLQPLKEKCKYIRYKRSEDVKN